MEVWRYNGRQRDGRDEAFVGGGSGSKSNSILLVVRDSTPDCHAIACDCKQLHAILKKSPFLSRLSEFLKIHREREAGLKFCLKCFFATTVNIFHIIFFAFLKKEEMRSRTHFTQQNVFLLFTVVVTKHIGRIFSPIPQNKFQTFFFL
jgi:hypothetical protein